MNGRVAGVLVLVAGCAAGPAATPPAVEPSPSEHPEPLAVVEVEPYVAGLVTAEVAIADSTLPFLVDTGGGITLVTPGAAAAIDCSPFGRGVGFRHDGERVELRRCTPTGLRIDGWRSPARELGVWDLMALIPEGLPTLGGLVSLDTFDGLAVTFDLGDERMVVESAASLARRIGGATEIPMRVAHQAGGASLDVFLAIAAEPGPLWFELDSGNTGPVRIAPHAARMLGLDLSEAEPRPVTLTLPRYGPVTVEAAEKEMIYDGLLNADFLLTHELTLDLAEERAWIGR